MRSLGLSPADYIQAYNRSKRLKTKSPLKDTYSVLGTISKDLGEKRSVLESHTDLIKWINALPKNSGKAFLNGERVTKHNLAMYLSDYPSKFNKDFWFMYINHEFQGIDIYVNLDDELAEKLNEADEGEYIEDSNGNEIRTKS